MGKSFVNKLSEIVSNSKYEKVAVFNKVIVAEMLCEMLNWKSRSSTISQYTIYEWIKEYNEFVADQVDKEKLIIGKDILFGCMDRLFRFLIMTRYRDADFFGEMNCEEMADKINRTVAQLTTYINDVAPMRDIRFEKRNEAQWAFQQSDLYILKRMAETSIAAGWDEPFQDYPITKFLSKFHRDFAQAGAITLRCSGTINYPDTPGYENQVTPIMYADIFTTSIRIRVKDTIVPGDTIFTGRYPEWFLRLRLEDMDNGTKYTGDYFYIHEIYETDPYPVRSTVNYDEVTGNLVITGIYDEERTTRTMTITIRPERTN